MCIYIYIYNYYYYYYYYYFPEENLRRTAPITCYHYIVSLLISYIIHRPNVIRTDIIRSTKIAMAIITNNRRLLMCMCMRICMYVCVYVCIFVTIHDMYVCKHIYIYIYIYMNKYIICAYNFGDHPLKLERYRED